MIRSCNKSFFLSLSVILLALELVFWTTSLSRIKKVKTWWFGEAGIWNRAFYSSIVLIQTFAIVSFPVLVLTTDMDELMSEVSASIGFATAAVFYISRVYIMEKTDG